MNDLREGTRIIQVQLDEHREIRLGAKNVMNIVITMENGQMGPVPWIKVVYTHKVQLINYAQVESVTLLLKS